MYKIFLKLCNQLLFSIFVHEICFILTFRLKNTHCVRLGCFILAYQQKRSQGLNIIKLGFRLKKNRKRVQCKNTPPFLFSCFRFIFATLNWQWMKSILNLSHTSLSSCLSFCVLPPT